MATSTASNFNASIGSLRERSNTDANFKKGMDDRLAMIKFDAPQAITAQATQVEAKLGATMGAFKSISDTKSAVQNISKSVGKIGDAVGRIRDMAGSSQQEAHSLSSAPDRISSGEISNPAFDSGSLDEGVSMRGSIPRTAIEGQFRTNPMNVATMTGDQTANNSLNELTESLRTRAGNVGANAMTSTNVHASVASVGDDIGEGISKVGEGIADVGSKVAEGVSAGLEGAGAVADALGPIGDLVGLGMAIFGGVEASKAHKDEVAKQAQAQAVVATPAVQNTTQSTSVSLDTSKPAQATAQSHY